MRAHSGMHASLRKSQGAPVALPAAGAAPSVRARSGPNVPQSSGRPAPGAKGTVRKTPQQPQKGTSTLSNKSARPQQAASGTVRKQASAKQTAKGGKVAAAPAAPKSSKAGQSYFNLTGFPFPLGPFFERKTIRREVEKGSVWVFEQTQSLEFFNVYTPVRMTVIKLASGGLWVHAPVAPTDECIRLIKELDAPVEHIVLTTFAYEHKVFVGPFSRRFPDAEVYIAPYQWSFPLNLPPQFFGIFPAGTLQTGDTSVPWADEIEQKVFLPPSIGVGDDVRFSEVAFFHKKSRTLLVTDAVIFVPEEPPEVIPRDAVLALARDGFLARFSAGGRSRAEVDAIATQGPAEDTPENIRKGWQRMALLVLYFGPGDLLTPQDSFAAISNRLFVGPVVETLVYSKIPKSVVDWVEDICADWQFRQIIPCHFAAPVKATPAEFRRAFAFAYELAEKDGLLPPPPAEEDKKKAAPGGPGGLFASLFSGLSGVLGGGGASGSERPVGQRPVVFPPADLKILNFLNDQLLSSGVVKRNADLELMLAARGASEQGAAAAGEGAAAAGEGAAVEQVVEDKQPVSARR